MNKFGRGGGFDLILGALEKKENMDASVVAYFSEMISLPCMFYKATFIEKRG